MGNTSLIVRARVYIGYYHIFKKNYRAAKRLIAKQVALATQIEDSEMVSIAEAALFRAKQEEERHKGTKNPPYPGCQRS